MMIVNFQVISPSVVCMKGGVLIVAGLQRQGGGGSYGRIDKYQKRKTEVGTDWPLESLSLHVCCFNTFITYWNNNFSSIKIKKSSHDTCGTCYEFEGLLNGLRRREQQTSIRVLREERLSLGVP